MIFLKRLQRFPVTTLFWKFYVLHFWDFLSANIDCIEINYLLVQVLSLEEIEIIESRESMSTACMISIL